MNFPSSILEKEITKDKFLCNIAGVLVFTAMTAFGAFIRIHLPFTPVPITAQTFFVLLSGVCLGSRLGFFSQLTYVILGTVGLPIFSGGASGLLPLFGPTGGYIIGFCLGSFIAGILAKFFKASFVGAVFSMSVGCLAIYLTGAVHLALLFDIGIKKTFYLGVLPFITADTLKILLASAIYIKFKTRISRVFCVL